MKKQLFLVLHLLLLGVGIMLPTMFAAKPAVLYRDQVAVLMYHHLHDTDQSTGTITPTLFKKQLTYLQSQGFRFISLQQFKNFLDGADVPPNAVLITFDDGYESFLHLALPILNEWRIPAVNFIITETLANTHGAYIPYMSAEQIAQMTSSHPGIEVQCHSDALHHKTDRGEALLIARLLDDQNRSETEHEYNERISHDLRSCTEKLKPLNLHRVDSLAYPFGIYHSTSDFPVQQAGIQYAFTIQSGISTRETNRLAIPRMNAGSPWITPEALKRMIMNHVTAFP